MYRRVHTAEMLYLFPCFQDLSTCGGPEQGLGLLLLERFDFQPSPAQLEYCESRPNACKAVRGACILMTRILAPAFFVTPFSLVGPQAFFKYCDGSSFSGDVQSGVNVDGTTIYYRKCMALDTKYENEAMPACERTGAFLCQGVHMLNLIECS